MNTRRQIIRIVPALPLMTAAGATALLAACGDKKAVDAAAPSAAPSTPTPTPAATPPVAATPAPAAAADTTAAATPAPASPAATATGALLDEKDPAAVGLGYVADSSKVDKAKYAQYVAGSSSYYFSSCLRPYSLGYRRILISFIGQLLPITQFFAPV